MLTLHRIAIDYPKEENEAYFIDDSGFILDNLEQLPKKIRIIPK